MSNAIDNGGPAFPCEGGPESGLHAAPGMTLRDYFAASALQGWITSQPLVGGKPLSAKADHAMRLANLSYAYADAMLAARSGTFEEST